MADVRILAVIDGDTLLVESRGERSSIDLAEIDAPELEQPFGLEAKIFLEKLIFNRAVQLSKTSEESTRRVSLLDGGDVSDELLTAGLAWYRPRDARDAPVDVHRVGLEKAARSARRGLWSQKDPVPPWEWRGEKVEASP